MEGFFPLAGFSAFVAFGTFGDGAAFVAIFFFLFLGSDEEAAARFGDPGGGTLSFGELGEATDERPVVMRALAISFAFFVFFFFGVFPPFPCFARFPDAGTAWYGSGAFRLRLELLPTRFATAPGSSRCASAVTVVGVYGQVVRADAVLLLLLVFPVRLVEWTVVVGRTLVLRGATPAHALVRRLRRPRGAPFLRFLVFLQPCHF
jgi:hypothetical protein